MIPINRTNEKFHAKRMVENIDRRTSRTNILRTSSFISFYIILETKLTVKIKSDSNFFLHDFLKFLVITNEVNY